MTGNERTFRTAMGDREKALGFRKVESEAVTSSGRVASVAVDYQVGPVTRPIVSTSAGLFGCQTEPLSLETDMFV